MSRTDFIRRSKGSLLGLAIGDAVGTTLEFKVKDSYEHIKDMVGGGPFNLEVGEWTDDTSMALCLADSLIEMERHHPCDQLERYIKWRDEGYNSVNGYCFDIGMTVDYALDEYIKTGEDYPGSRNPKSAGNGGIMRLAPTVIFHSTSKGFKRNYMKKMSALSSRTTHGCPSCMESAEMYALAIDATLAGLENKMDVIHLLINEYPLSGVDEDKNPEIFKLRSKIEDLLGEVSRDQIFGKGYVINSLQAALWCFLNSDSFREGVLLAANLGDDADTTAAIYGQIGGAFYGVDGLPSDWLEKIKWRDIIEDKAHSLAVAKKHVWY